MGTTATAGTATAGSTRPGGVVILGMHRSGTSAVAGFLAKAGFFAGGETELLAPAEDNPKGFFERADVNALNDKVLYELGGAWDKPPPRDLVRRRAPAWQAQVNEALADLEAGAAGRPLVLKDPRIGLLLPAWLPAIDSRFAIVFVDRSALDIALSVRRRDGRPLYVALALWQLYCAELLDGLAGHRVLVVHYESFVEDPARNGRLLLERLAEVLPAEQVDAALAEGFVSQDMRHHQTSAKSALNLEVLTTAQLALARWLAELTDGWVDLAPPAKLRAQPRSALTTVAEHYEAVADRYGMETAYDTERHKALHFEQATELKDRHIENIEGALANLQKLTDAQTARIAELEAALDASRAGSEALRKQLQTLREDGRAAATNLVTLAKRSLSSRGLPSRGVPSRSLPDS